MNLDNLLNEVFKAVLVAVLPVISAFVIKWLYNQVRVLRAKVNDTHYALLLKTVQIFVEAAEQAGLVGIIENIGEEKKAYVLELLQTFATEHGIKVNVIELEALIEMAIHSGWQKISEDNSEQPNGLSAYTPENQ